MFQNVILGRWMALMEKGDPHSHAVLPIYLSCIAFSISLDAAQAFGQARVALDGAKRLHDILVNLNNYAKD